MLESLTAETFTSRMKDVLVEWPLYRQLQFTGSVTHTHVSPGRDSFPGPRTSEYVVLPEQIEMLCSHCMKEQRWKLVQPHNNYPGAVFRMNSEHVKAVYVCRNCERSTATYHLLFSVNDDGGTVSKVGQFPALEREPSPILASAMDKGDLLLYRHALTCRNSNMGIAAVA